jgi:nucleotide-binding universal stress UspA family protein
MPFEHILVAIDGSESSSHALDTAIELASLLGAQLTALAVKGPLPAYAATLGEVDEVKREKDRFFGGLCADATKRARDAGIDLDVRLRPGHAAELIARYAVEVRADLIVVGHKGHFARTHLLGSTADRVANHARAPVLIVR